MTEALTRLAQSLKTAGCTAGEAGTETEARSVPENAISPISTEAPRIVRELMVTSLNASAPIEITFAGM